MTNAPTNTFKNRNKSAVVGKSAEDQAKVAFGKSIQLIAAKSRAYISKNMFPGKALPPHNFIGKVSLPVICLSFHVP